MWNVARQLIAAKTQLREKEFAAAERYLARLREGTPETIESYSLDLDILRDLKRIHSHLCSAAYPVLERAGALQRSRLKDSAFGRRKGAANRLRAINRPTRFEPQKRENTHDGPDTADARPADDLGADQIRDALGLGDRGTARSMR
jgi:hypothetical protein